MTEKKKSAKKEDAEQIDGPVKQVKKIKAKELIEDEGTEDLVTEEIDGPAAMADQEAISEEAETEKATAETYGFEPEVKKEKRVTVHKQL